MITAALHYSRSHLFSTSIGQTKNPPCWLGICTRLGAPSMQSIAGTRQPRSTCLGWEAATVMASGKAPARCKIPHRQLTRDGRPTPPTQTGAMSVLALACFHMAPVGNTGSASLPTELVAPAGAQRTRWEEQQCQLADDAHSNGVQAPRCCCPRPVPWLHSSSAATGVECMACSCSWETLTPAISKTSLLPAGS